MNYFLTWEEAFLSGASLSGGKGWNLGRLCRYGFNIPKGGVLAAQVYHRYMKYNGLQNRADNIASFITTENMGEADVKNSLEQLRRKILGGSMPPDILKDLKDQLYSLGGLEKSWAVRSSAVGEDSENNSFAGIHDSFLNVNGIDDILSAVKGCYASLWSQRAIVYRKRMKLSNNVAAAVVIMEMVKAQVAGVGFTCDIQSGRLDRMIINANFGLGESVVNGSVDPDIYYLDMDVLNSRPRIVERKIGSKKGITVLNGKNGTTFMAAEQSSSDQVLSDENIIKLGAIMERVFDALGNSEQQQDVEWVYDGRDFILVQSRPVTIMPRKTFPALQNRSDVWSNGNYRDAVPMVQSPLNRRLMKSIIDNIHYKSFTVLDYQLPVGIQFSRFFKGRLYCNLSAYQWALYDCMGSRPDGFNMFWGGHQPSIDIGDLKPRKGFEERTMKF